MKKLLLLTIIISGCTLVSPKHNNTLSSFETLKQFRIGQDNISDIVNKLGQPSEKTEDATDYVYSYNTNKDAYPRAVFNFTKNTKILESIVWSPEETEKENFLEGAKAQFPNSLFKKVLGNTGPHQAFPTEANLIDKENGVSIFYNIKNESVVAIGLFEKKERTPAEISK